MEKRLLTFAEPDVYPLAHEYFKKYCGITSNSDKHQRMYEDGMHIRECGVGGIDIKARLALLEADAFHQSAVRWGDLQIRCRAFEQIPPQAVCFLYVFLLTVGEVACDYEDKVANRLFADVWGNSYVDASKDLLEKWMADDAERLLEQRGERAGYLSASFGPGYFGMEMTQNPSLGELIDAEELGVTVRENGIMIPVKTISGIHFVVRDEAALPQSGCQECRGGARGCHFCHVKNRCNTETIQ